MKKNDSDAKRSQCDCSERVFDEFLEDIENDIKMEKYCELWKKHRKWVSALATVVSCVVIIFGFWNKYRNEQCQIYAGRFIEAQNLISQERNEDALAVIKDIENHDLKIYSVLSKLLHASILVKRDFAKNAAEAQLIYKSILDGSAPVYVKELAAVLYVNACLQHSDVVDEETAKKLQKILKTYSKSKAKNGVSLLARELICVILLRTNKVEKAKKSIDKLCRNENIPPNMRFRLMLMLQYIQDIRI
ncbi:MAG: hypothetical protein LBD36_02865 [Holosporales bacterium]|jgi:hypothetical protein|nr:hypothetical protein [Holosporales bacterium]